MSVGAYRERISGVLSRIWETQTANIEKASAVMADCISRGGLVHLFGSGHSVLPVQDIFPRYGAFPGFRPLMDMRLMWTNVVGSGGAKGLLWLERRYSSLAVMRGCLAGFKKAVALMSDSSQRTDRLQSL